MKVLNKEIHFMRTTWDLPAFAGPINTDNWRRQYEQSKKKGYSGFEVWVAPFEKNPKEQHYKGASIEQVYYHAALAKEFEMKNIAQIHIDPNESESYTLDQFDKSLKAAYLLNACHINSHTGSDWWSDKEVDSFLKQLTLVEKEHNKKRQGQPILNLVHETHRTRCLYNIKAGERIISKHKKNVNLNLDISHWVLVGERLFDNQDGQFHSILEKISPNIGQIHARIGSPNTIQVIDPAADQDLLKWYTDTWRFVIQRSKFDTFYITTEFGPVPYSHVDPVNKQVLGDSDKANDYMLQVLKERLA